MEYYYIMMSQKDMLKNEVLEEILRERNNYYLLKKRLIDFWVLISPNFLSTNEIKKNLEKTNYIKQNSKENNISELSLLEKNSKFFSILISSDKDFINWIRLRIGFFEDINDMLNDSLIKSNGIYGFIQTEKLNASFLPINSNNFMVDPFFLVSKYKKVIEYL